MKCYRQEASDEIVALVANDRTVYDAMMQCAIAGVSYKVFLEKLVKTLVEEKSSYRQAALDIAHIFGTPLKKGT